MESANIHQHHHHLQQDQLVGSSSSSSSTSYVSLATPSVYGVGATTTSWIPNSILNTNGFSLYAQVPRQQQHQENLFPNSVPYMNFNMPPDLSYISAPGSFTNHSEIKEEHEFSSENYYLKFTDMLNSSPSSSITQDEIIRRNIDDQTSDIRTKMLLTSSRIFPSVNVPNSYQHELGNSHNVPSGGGSFDMNLQALDLLASSRFGGNLMNSSSSSQNQIGVYGDGISSYGFDDHMRQNDQISSFTANKMPQFAAPSSHGNPEPKRKMDQPKQSNAPKKSRNETRAACPPFKVRKEKLGDRIAALQQLVAPFGKTDTASVLMEAIGYIKFLQDQVETLSVPYMKASRNKNTRSVNTGVVSENENCEQMMKRDLKTRGLCLVPLSCLSYISDGGGGAVWPMPNFGGPN